MVAPGTRKGHALQIRQHRQERKEDRHIDHDIDPGEPWPKRNIPAWAKAKLSKPMAP